MKVLILGGTRFLGRALVDSALAAGHDVTLFNRGKSNPELYPELEQVKGDRDGGLRALRGRNWDIAIDTCGFIPRLVRDSAEFLATAVDHYAFISTLSVYADPANDDLDEDAYLATIEDDSVEEITADTYGPLKALCEKAASEAMDGRALSVRAGLIVGPHDLSDRFSYWPYRLSSGGEVLAPGNPFAPVQFIDVRDLAEWTLRASQARLVGPYNVTGPDYQLQMGEVLHACQQATGSDTTFTWVTDAFLEANQVAAYTEMPLWLPAEYEKLSTVDCSRAIAAGLTFRPLGETIQDTLAWLATRPGDYQWRAGLSAEREAELLRQWHRQKG